jgi:3-deoxy-D-manno-octulosonate 8-phosphate phosphatase (KDO 8-P phosphatase)
MKSTKVKLLIIDVDGTLTDGVVAYNSEKVESKNFSIKDGLILKVLPKIKISVIFLTGRISKLVEKRGNELDVSCILQGISDKKNALLSYIAEHKIDLENVSYIGDDLNDYAAMKLCGFKACPADAATEIREICDYVSSFNGGQGAVRDICEYILKQNGKYETFLNLFGIK